MKVLKARLYDMKMKNQAGSDQQDQEGHRGSQIRSYVLHPIKW
jgi:protein subunit release factor B